MTAEYQSALRELQLAQHQFEQADPSHPDNIDIAIHRLIAAELRFGVAVRGLKTSAQ